MVELARQIMRSGLGNPEEIQQWLARGEISLNGASASAEAVLRAEDIVDIRGQKLRVTSVGAGNRLLLEYTAAEDTEKIPGLTRVHCGLHKCLTMYTRNVYQHLCRDSLGGAEKFRHFFHRRDCFYREAGNYAICSLSGHSLDLDRFEDVRICRFLRDPRDLLISGYFYHRRGAEHWSCFRNPQPAEWAVINAPVPEMIPEGMSFSGYLESVSMEEGLLAEIEFRRNHFQSMREWNADDRIRCYRYEDIIGRERETFRDLLDFFELPWRARRRGLKWAKRFSAGRRSNKDAHIRDPRGGQWREHFTSTVNKRFNEAYGDLLEQLGYPIKP